LDTFVSVLAVLSPVLVFVLAGVGWLYRHERERREAAERQVSEHKYKAYIALLDIFFDLMKATKLGRKVKQNELIDRMYDVNKELVLYGSDDVVRIYLKWLENARKHAYDTENFAALGALQDFGALVVGIRRDMGYAKTKISTDDVLRHFITDYDEAKAKDNLVRRIEKGP